MARVVSLEETDNSILMRGTISLLLISHKACIPTLVQTFNIIIEDRNGCYHSYKYLCVGLKEMTDTPPVRLYNQKLFTVLPSPKRWSLKLR